MYKTIPFEAANDADAKKKVTKLLKAENLETWQIVNFSPVHNKEAEYNPDVDQYKIIVLLTADQVQALTAPTTTKKGK